MNEFCILSRESLLERAANPQVDSRQCQREAGQRRRLASVHHIQRQKKRGSVEQWKQCQSNGRPRKAGRLFVASHQGNYGKQGREQCSEQNRKRTLVQGIIVVVPTKIENDGSCKTSPEQTPPWFEDGSD